MSLLLKLPFELLELGVCQFLDVTATVQLSLVNRSFQQNIAQCPKLWKTLTCYHFGYTSKPLLDQRAKSESDDSRTNKIRWRAVFLVAWQDSVALAPTALVESNVLRLYRQQLCNDASLLLQPREAQIRQEILLMEGLRRLPTSEALIQLYAELIRQAQLVTRTSNTSKAKHLHDISQQ